MNRYRDVLFNRVLAPEGEPLSFAPPKESSQRKGGPVAAHVCAPRICRGAAEWASCPSAAVRHPCRTPNGLFPTNTPVLDAANGRKARYCVASAK